MCLGRLKKRPEFLAVTAAQKKWVADSVIVQVGPAQGASLRVGYTATKKIGNAVIRNRCKRRLRAAMDRIVAQYSLKAADIVLVARATTADCDWNKLYGDVKWCLKRLDLLIIPSSESA